MQLHTLRSVHKLRRKKRIGRGGKRGTYSGRGIKGQKARAGAKIRPQERELITKLPKLRGIRFRSLKDKPVIVNLGLLEKMILNGGFVTPDFLVKMGLVSLKAGRIPKIKILGEGSLSKSLTVKGIMVSRQAKTKIEAAGGKVIL